MRQRCNPPHMLIRFLLSIAALPLSFIALGWAFSEVAVHYEIWATGASSRAQLADDFGLGLLIVGVAWPAAALGSVVVTALAWRGFFRYRQAHKSSLSKPQPGA